MYKALIFTILLFFHNVSYSISTSSGITKIHNEIVDHISTDGSTDLNNVKCKSADIEGTLTFNEVTVEKKIRIGGSANGNKISCDYLEVDGSFTVTDAKTNMAVISGSLNATNMSIINNLKLDGPLNANNITVDGYAEIDGTMNVINSKFGDIVLTSANSSITDSTTGNITVRSGSNKVPQQLILKGNTTVNGNIVFAAGNGIVIMDPSVKLNGNMYGCTEER